MFFYVKSSLVWYFFHIGVNRHSNCFLKGNRNNVDDFLASLSEKVPELVFLMKSKYFPCDWMKFANNNKREKSRKHEWTVWVAVINYSQLLMTSEYNDDCFRNKGKELFITQMVLFLSSRPGKKNVFVQLFLSFPFEMLLYSIT